MTPLREARKRRGLTVAQVANAVGTDPSNLSRLELGHHQPPKELARQLYRFYAGEIAAIDIYDPTFMDEVGVITACGRGWYRIKTRTGERSVRCRNGIDEMAGVD